MRSTAVLTMAFALSLPAVGQKLTAVSFAPPTPEPAPSAVGLAAFQATPISGLLGNGRALLIVAPDSSTPALRQQMRMLDRHELALTSRNTVLVPVIARKDAAQDVFAGENLHFDLDRDLAAVRQHFGVKSGEFAVILLDVYGREEFRSTRPLSIADLTARMDSRHHLASGQGPGVNR